MTSITIKCNWEIWDLDVVVVAVDSTHLIQFEKTIEFIFLLKEVGLSLYYTFKVSKIKSDIPTRNWSKGPKLNQP